jgi:hypothetical protein
MRNNLKEADQPTQQGATLQPTKTQQLPSPTHPVLKKSQPRSIPSHTFPLSHSLRAFLKVHDGLGVLWLQNGRRLASAEAGCSKKQKKHENSRVTPEGARFNVRFQKQVGQVTCRGSNAGPASHATEANASKASKSDNTRSSALGVFIVQESMYPEDEKNHRGSSAQLGDFVGIDEMPPHRGCVDCHYNRRYGIVVRIGASSLTLRMLSRGDFPSAHVIVPKCAVYTSRHGLFQLDPDTAAYSTMLELEVGRAPYGPARTAEHCSRTCLRCLKPCDDTSFLLVHPLYHSTKAVCKRCLETTRPGRCVVCFDPSKPDPKGLHTPEALLQHAREVQCASCTGCGRCICTKCMAQHLPFCLKYGVLPQIRRCVPKFTCGHCDHIRDLTLPPLTLQQQALEDARSFLDLGLGYDSGLDDCDSDSDSESDVLIRFEEFDPEEETLLFKTATGDVSLTRAKFQRLLRTAELV